MDVRHLLPRSNDARFLDVPYEDRWECLKPVIVQLYMGKYGPNGKSMTTGQVLVFMRDHYSFFAAENQYRHHFNKWGVRRRIRSTEKDAIVAAVGRRPQTGSTSDVTLDHDKAAPRAVDKRQLGRYVKDQMRHQHRDAEPMLPGVLSSWNLPSAAYFKALGQIPGQPSPFGGNGATPSYLDIPSPKAITPGGAAAAAAADAPTPTMKLVRQKLAYDRSNLLLQGHHLDLLKSCGKEDRVALTNYLHDFYLHSFVVAKYWGRGPLMDQWTAGLVAAFTLGSFDVAGPASLTFDMSPEANAGRLDKLVDPPSQLCKWSIHVSSINYTAIPEQVVNAQDGFDIQDPRSWREWPLEEQSRPSMSFAESMQKSITNSTFSSMPPDSLPISTEAISQSTQKDPEALLVDAWKIVIMSGNADLLSSLYDEIYDVPKNIDDIYPFHLAASFLDGGHTCCSMISELSQLFEPSYLFFHPRDDLGHTVLDTLLITVLRSHTMVPPEQVSTLFNPPHRFPGEEKDTCGRWDADSPAVRALFQNGFARIPTSWKHAFCHTAAQAVCHGIIAILGSPASPRIDSLSGLFVRRCNNCQQELKLGPLHTLIVVAFHLAHCGMPGETLFGALAILVCLLSLGANVSLQTDVSIQDILGRAEPGTCHHKLMDVCDLTQEVPDELVSQWTPECQTGWMCILQTLLLAKRDRGLNKSKGMEPETETDDSDCHSDASADQGLHQQRRDCGLVSDWGVHDEFLRLPCGHSIFGLLWATIQVELLTYRRISTADPWVSDKFSMAALRTWLRGESSEFHTPLVERGMMRDHSRCGWFEESPESDFLCPIADEVCREHFMNMDVYDRTTFIPRKELCEFWVDIGCSHPEDR